MHQVYSNLRKVSYNYSFRNLQLTIKDQFGYALEYILLDIPPLTNLADLLYAETVALATASQV